jgi:hypothetical protein
MHIWLQLEFPWIGYGFIGAVSERYAETFAAELQELGFAVVNIRAGTDRADVIEASVGPYVFQTGDSRAGTHSVTPCANSSAESPRHRPSRRRQTRRERSESLR